MKLIALTMLTTTLLTGSAYGSASKIICGTQPGEIYFVGPVPHYQMWPGLWYSSNYGTTLELRDQSQYETYGGIWADAADSSLYRSYQPPNSNHEEFSSNGGNDWVIVNTENADQDLSYASGVIPGEVYRSANIQPFYHILERSTNNGIEYVQCSTTGFPDTLGIYTAALGADPGEVYICSNHGYLYYSADYGENFSFQGDVGEIAEVPNESVLLNGAEPGEIYLFWSNYFDERKIWRFSDYGISGELLYTFYYGIEWATCRFSTSGQPGEIYFYAVNYHPYSGGVVHILHTTDYGQNWDFYQHDLTQNAIELKIPSAPSLEQITVWPNPFNASTSIHFELGKPSTIRMTVYDIRGDRVRQLITDKELIPGGYNVSWTAINENRQPVASGIYLLEMQVDQFKEIKKMVLVR